MVEEVFEDIWLYKDGVAVGVAKGEVKGKRSLIERLLSAHFPGEVFPQIEGFSQAEDLDRLFDALIKAQTAEAARASIQSALRRH